MCFPTDREGANKELPSSSAEHILPSSNKHGPTPTGVPSAEYPRAAGLPMRARQVLLTVAVAEDTPLCYLPLSIRVNKHALIALS